MCFCTFEIVHLKLWPFVSVGHLSLFSFSTKVLLEFLKIYYIFTMLLPPSVKKCCKKQKLDHTQTFIHVWSNDLLPRDRHQRKGEENGWFFLKKHHLLPEKKFRTINQLLMKYSWRSMNREESIQWLLVPDLYFFSIL